MEYQQPFDVMTKLESLSVEQLKEILQVLGAGKQQNDIKVKMLVEKLPDFTCLASAQKKLNGSYEEAVAKTCAAVWNKVTTQSGGGKFNMDILKMLLKQIIKAQGGDDMDD